MAKRVLLSYLERNKIVDIPERKEENDVQYMKNEFLNIFNLIDDVTVDDVFFQKFDEEWDAFIDLEDDDELNDKDKVKAVVTHTHNLQSPKWIDSMDTSIIYVRKLTSIFILCPYNR